MFNMSVYADPRPVWHDPANGFVPHDRINLHHGLFSCAVERDALAQEIDLDRDDPDRIVIQALCDAPDHGGGGLFHDRDDCFFALIDGAALRQARGVLVAQEAVQPIGHFLALQYNRRHENIPRIVNPHRPAVLVPEWIGLPAGRINVSLSDGGNRSSGIKLKRFRDTVESSQNPLFRLTNPSLRLRCWGDRPRRFRPVRHRQGCVCAFQEDGQIAV